jgi:hypothetical protein
MFYTPIQKNIVQRIIRTKKIYFYRKIKKDKHKYSKIKRRFKGFFLG